MYKKPKNANKLQPSRLTREELLEAATHNPEILRSLIREQEDEPYLLDLCRRIKQETICEDDVVRNDGVCPCYQEALQQYGSVEELCNANFLSYEDVYDYRTYTYCEEYIRGFLGIDDGELETYEDMTEAYLQGEEDVELLQSLIV